jgi:ABC-2 type transport system permease protein
MSATPVELPVTESAPASVAMTSGRMLRAYLIEAKYEFLLFVRSPGFSIPFILLPVILYLFFSSMVPGTDKEWLGAYIVVNYAVYGCGGPALFSFGLVLGLQRDGGLINFKRAMPVPPLSLLVAKMAMAMGSAALVTTMIIVTALVLGRLTFTAGEVASVVTVLMLGVLPFAAIGLFIGAHLRGGAAAGVTNLFYMPMMFLGGLFFQLPKSMQPLMYLSPAYHLDQLALKAAHLESNLAINPLYNVAFLGILTVVCTTFAIRRLTKIG